MNGKRIGGIVGAVGVAAAITVATPTAAQAAAPARVYTGQPCPSFGSTGVWPYRTTWNLLPGGDKVDQCGYRKKVQSGAFYSYTQTVYIGKIRKDCGPAWYQQNC